MARNFDGTDDKIDFGKAVHSSFSSVNSLSAVASSIQSHGSPFRLANGNLIVAYSTNEDGGDHEISCKISTDDGATWGSRIEIETDTASTNAYECAFAQLADGSETVFAFIGDGTTLQYRTSTDDGATWSSATTITSGTVHDSHPTAVKIVGGSNDEDLIVAYVRDGDVYCKYSTDDGSTWSSEVTILSDAVAKRDPHMVILPSGDLACLWTDGTGASVSTLSFAKSTDDGRTWGADSVIITLQDSTSINPGGSILVCDGYTLVFYANGNDLARTGWAAVYDQELTRYKYTISVDDTSADDVHRVKGILNNNRVPLVFYTSYNGGADYGVEQVKQDRRFQPIPDINDLENYTAWGWIKYSGNQNAAGGMYILAKNGVVKVPMYIQDNGSSSINQLRCYNARSGTDRSYSSDDNVITDNELTFVVCVHEEDAASSNKVRMYAGTTPANLAEVTYSEQVDGSGNLEDDAAGNMVVGTRTSDNDRVFDGDIGCVGYTPEILDFDINVLKALMVLEHPSEIGIIPAFFTKNEGAITPVDYMTGRIGTVTGAIDAGYSYPYNSSIYEAANSSLIKDTSLGIAVTGTVTASIEELDIIIGGKTLILTITEDTWVAAGATFDAQRQAIINGLDSAQAEGTGWDAEVKAKEVVTSVVRTSNTVVTITLSAASAYNISAQEIITATIPAAALVVSASEIVASPTFTVDFIPYATITGTITPSTPQEDIVTGGKTIIITLVDDTWAPTVGANNAITTALIAGIDSNKAEAAGWDAVVKANMDFNDVVRTSDTVVTITLGAEASFAITEAEIITTTIPASAQVTGASPLVANQTFSISAGGVLAGSLSLLGVGG